MLPLIVVKALALVTLVSNGAGLNVNAPWVDAPSIITYRAHQRSAIAHNAFNVLNFAPNGEAPAPCPKGRL